MGQRRATIPLRESIEPDTPLRLDVAARLAYPDGSMSGSGLRAEARRGRLVIERTAGKFYTTLANIERMREKCRLVAKGPGSGSGQQGETGPGASPTPQPGSFGTPALGQSGLDALRMMKRELSASSPITSPESTSRPRRRGNVVSIKSRSPTP